MMRGLFPSAIEILQDPTISITRSGISSLELLSLMVLPSCKRDIARVLFNSGIKSPIELSELNYDAIYVIIKESTIVGISQEDIKQILKEAKEYTKSLHKIEQLEENAIIAKFNS